MRKNLKDARNKLGLTQRQMAEMLKISYIYYQSIEEGKRIGTVKIWDSIEDLTGVNQRFLREY